MAIPIDNVTPRIRPSDVAEVIPSTLRSGDSETTIATKIADRGISNWFNSPMVKSSTIGQLAEKTQEKLKTDVTLPPATESGVSHKFSVKVEAIQALAKIEYTGWLDAVLNYDLKAACTDILFKEKVFNNKDLYLTHREGRDDRVSMVGVSWSF